jgi:16S rRNA (guanine527-N7)-methyltransferase
VNVEAFRQGLGEIGLDLNDVQIKAFIELEEALYRANAVMNLTRVPRDECYTRHFIDSLLFHDLIPEGVELLDIGTGPGFPAIPLAIARPDLQVSAMDSNGKMLNFLRENCPPNVLPLPYRAEEWGVSEAFGVVTGRAVAPLALQLELSATPCELGGAVLPMRTGTDAAAITPTLGNVLGLRLDRVEKRRLPGTDIDRLFPVYRKVKETPSKYPRRWSDMKQKPLK